MECVKYEWKKFVSFRFFWLLCMIVFTFNLWNLSENVKMSWPSAEAVKELYADLNRQPKEEQGRWLQTLGENELMPYTRNPYTEEELYDKFAGICSDWTVRIVFGRHRAEEREYVKRHFLR